MISKESLLKRIFANFKRKLIESAKSKHICDGNCPIVRVTILSNGNHLLVNACGKTNYIKR